MRINIFFIMFVFIISRLIFTTATYIIKMQSKNTSERIKTIKSAKNIFDNRNPDKYTNHSPKPSNLIA